MTRMAGDPSLHIQQQHHARSVGDNRPRSAHEWAGLQANTGIYSTLYRLEQVACMLSTSIIPAYSYSSPH